MVITFICEVLGEENNGTTIATMNQIRHLQKKGHEVHIVCPDEDKRGLPGYLVIPRIHFGPLDGYVAKNGVTLSSSKGFRKGDELKSLIRKSDIIHFNFASKLTLLCTRYAHQHGVACTASFHTQAENFTNHVGLMKNSLANALMYYIINHRLFLHVDAIHYPTQFMHDIFRKYHHTHAKEYIVSNGTQMIFSKTEVQRKPEFEGKIIITTTGRYSREKSQKTLLKAIKYSKYNDKIQLIIAGEGPLHHKFAKMGGKYCANAPILGFHSRQALAEILNMTDIYVHCSYADLEAISCLEALSVGIAPLLADSPYSAVSSFALDKERNVFHYGKPKDLAAKIDYFIEHPEEREENAALYRGISAKFKLEKMMEKMETMFLETIDDYRRTHPEQMEAHDKEREQG